MAKGKIRILVGKPGLDGHDRGAKVVARALRDAGMEVIYTGLHRSPEEIVETAIQEDVDAIGLSVLSGAHMTVFPKVVQLLKEQGAEDILVFGGGIVPEEDRQELLKQGVAEIFIPGNATKRTIEFLKEHYAKKQGIQDKASSPKGTPSKK
jgi:methylmalonyl-CoA mutase C-terminal domain/subunit